MALKPEPKPTLLEFTTSGVPRASHPNHMAGLQPEQAGLWKVRVAGCGRAHAPGLGRGHRTKLHSLAALPPWPESRSHIFHEGFPSRWPLLPAKPLCPPSCLASASINTSSLGTVGAGCFVPPSARCQPADPEALPLLPISVPRTGWHWGKQNRIGPGCPDRAGQGH